MAYRSYYGALGVDPGIKNTGFAFVTTDLNIVRSGVITTSSGDPLVARIEHIIDWLQTHLGQLSLDSSPYHITTKVICVENQTLFSRQQHFRTAIDSTIKVQGAVIGWAAQLRRVIISPTAQEWQSTFAKGRKKKKKIQRKISRVLGWEVPDHISDAIGLAVFALPHVKKEW